MRNLFKSLDLFGTNFNFKINQNQLVKSTFGGVLSICLILLSITFIFLFGKDCFFRQSSRLLFQNVIINDPLNKTINNDNFTIGFMTISDGREIPIPDYLDVRIAYYRHFLNRSSEFGEYQYFTTVLEWDLCSKIKA